MKFFFEVLGPNNIAAKNGLSISNSFCTGPCTKFAPFSISTREFCKNLQKFACFVTFGCIRTCLIMRTLKNSKFDTYWLTLVYSEQRWCMLLTILVYNKSACTWSTGTQSYRNYPIILQTMIYKFHSLLHYKSKWLIYYNLFENSFVF